MHDPSTLVYNIPWILTVWHQDPETDGTDDSCGWFMRERHVDRAKLERVAQEFEHQWSGNSLSKWFNSRGVLNYSPQAVTLSMFLIASNIHFGHWSPKSKAFLRDRLFEILHFSENNMDSLYTFLAQPYGIDPQDTAKTRSRRAAEIVYSWICRAARPWWKHPRWHFWHWKIQLHPWNAIRRRYWEKCAVCGRRGFKESPMGSWDGDRIWHQVCDASLRVSHLNQTQSEGKNDCV